MYQTTLFFTLAVRGQNRQFKLGCTEINCSLKHHVISSCWVLYHNVIIDYASSYGSPMGLNFLIERKNARETQKSVFF